MSLEKLTASLKDKIGDYSPIEAVIKFDFPGEGVIRIDGKSSPTIVDNLDAGADCTLKMTMDDFKEMAAGTLNPQKAFMTGKLRVEGDMSLAMQLSQIMA